MNCTAECTWGDGPDVLLTINGQMFDLTVDQAEALTNELLSATVSVRQLEDLVEQNAHKLHQTTQ